MDNLIKIVTAVMYGRYNIRISFNCKMRTYCSTSHTCLWVLSSSKSLVKESLKDPCVIFNKHPVPKFYPDQKLKPLFECDLHD